MAQQRKPGEPTLVPSHVQQGPDLIAQALAKATGIGPRNPMDPGRELSADERLDVSEGPTSLDQLVQAAYDMVGMPEAGAPAQAVTTFGSKALRSLATQESSEALIQLLTQYGFEEKVAERFVTQLAKRYPRVLAHVEEWRPTRQGDRATGRFRSDSGMVEGRGPIELQPPTRRKTIQPRTSPENSYENTIWHELTHVAQNLGKGGNMAPSYGLFNRLLGYGSNPYEIAARKAALARTRNLLNEGVRPAKSVRGPRTVNQIAPQFADTLSFDPSNPPGGPGIPAPGWEEVMRLLTGKR